MMDRPYIVCHILSSMDGRIDGDFFGMDKTMAVYPEFGKIRDSYRCDAVLNGAVTAAEIYRVPLTEGNIDIDNAEPKEDFAARTDAEKYAVVIDAEGRMTWENGDIERRGEKLHIVAVLTEAVSETYLAKLREAGVSYIFAGETALDLPLATRKLKSVFGIDRLLLSGGGVVNWSFLQVGLIDELSVALVPVAEGKRGVATIFDESPYLDDTAPVAFDLKAVRQLSGGGLWLNYIPKNII